MDEAAKQLLKEGFRRALSSPSALGDIKGLFTLLAEEPDKLLYHKRTVGIPLRYETVDEAKRFVAALDKKYPTRAVE